MYAVLGIVAIVAGYVVFRPAGRQAAAVRIVARPIHAVAQFFVPDPQKLFGKSRVRVLVVGLDYDYDSKDQETSKNARSDIIMALSLDFAHDRVNELSIPRDMVATMPDGRRAKINEAQSEGGIAESQKVVADWLGTPSFDRYVVLRIDTAKDLVNAIGGVDIDVKNSDALKGTGPNGPIDYDDHWGHLSIHLKPGMHHLDGENAVAYARFRHDWCSDPCRIMRQQQLIHALVDKIESQKLNTLTHVQSLLAVMRKDVDTNITPQEQLSSVVALAHTAPKDIQTAQVPYVRSIDLPGYGDTIVPDDAERRRLVAALLLDPVTAPAPPAIAAASVSPAPAAVRIRVENGTHVIGLAAKIAGELRAQGYTITDVTDADSHDIAATQIHTSRADAPAAAQVRKALGSGVATAAVIPDAPPATVRVVLGSDIIATVP
jgi:LCP family protein required for cell wall assembly